MKSSRSNDIIPVYLDTDNLFVKAINKAFRWCAHRDYSARLVIYAGGGDGPRTAEYYYKSISVATKKYVVLKTVEPQHIVDHDWLDIEIYYPTIRTWIPASSHVTSVDEVHMLMGDFDD